MDFPAGKSIRSLERAGRAGFVFFSKENQFRWFCLETQEKSEGRKEGGGKQEERERGMGSPPFRVSRRKLEVEQMPHVCTRPRAARHASRPTAAHADMRTHRQSLRQTDTHEHTCPSTCMCTCTYTHACAQPSSTIANSRQ